MDINDNDAGAVFSLQEHGLMSLRMQNNINTEWENSMHSGHDAFYIVRKRSLLLDLWNMQIPSESFVYTSPLSVEEELAKNYREFAQREFLKEVSEDKDSWYADVDPLSNKDNAWNWDCPKTIQ